MFNHFLLFGLSAPIAIIIALVGLAILVFEVAMFINVILNKSITTNAKVLWAVGMILIHPFVAIFYYFTDYKKTK